jgi:chemotaxis protein methyltransferase CheR
MMVQPLKIRSLKMKPIRKLVESYKLSHLEFNLFRDYMHKVTGIYLDNFEWIKNKIEKGLSRRVVLHRLHSMTEYINFLKREKPESEWDILIDLVTVNFTQFYRYPDQINVFERLLKVMIEQKRQTGDLSLKIWSAGCSTGEEPYTLAICLCEILPDIKDWNIEIIANDINHRAITVSKAGQYDIENTGLISKELLSKYFLISESTVSFIKQIKDLVTFKIFNLMDDDSMFEMTKFDFIFCRNVLIYFSEKARNKIIHQFYRKLKSTGYYFTGHVETIDMIGGPFQHLPEHKAMVYKKKLSIYD